MYSDNGIYKNFSRWRDSIQHSTERGRDAIDEISTGAAHMTESFIRGLTWVGLVDKDFWVLNFSPPMAKKFLKASGDYIDLEGLNDWYQVMMCYISMQDSYRSMKNKIVRIDKILKSKCTQSSGYIRSINMLNTYSDLADRYYRYLDDIVRYHIIDGPMVYIGEFYYMKFVAAKNWIDDESAMSNAVIHFSSYVYPQWMVKPNTVSYVVEFVSQFKSSYGSNNYEELCQKAKRVI